MLKQRVLILGAGTAGLTAANRLAELGLASLVVEKGLFPGGHVASLACKATTSCAQCHACLLEETAAKAAGAAFRLSLQTSLISCRPNKDQYLARLARGPYFIDSDKCLDCGLCYEACPEKDKAILRSPLKIGPRYGISTAACRRFNGRACQACLEACPAAAVNFEAATTEEEVSIEAVVMAGGFEPFDPRLKPRFGYGRLDGVVTALELDQSLRNQGRLPRPDGRSEVRKVAFIQCVGSRDKSLNRDYCSRVCCGYALRMAALIRHRWPALTVTMFYMDLQNAGRDFNRYYQDLKTKVELIQGAPGEVTARPDGGLDVPFISDQTGLKETRTFDLVVLSIGLGPPDLTPLAALNIPINQDGFLISQPERGLFAAGAAAGPMGVAEARASALKAALEATDYLKRT
ncbi:MAG: NAD(P)-binding protein [Thermodesulfobacteriota bacterium]